MLINIHVLKKIFNSYGPAILWSAIIITLLCIPGSDLPDESSFIPIDNIDKWVHFGIFMLFVILWNWAISKKKSQIRIIKKFILITLVGIVSGYFLELVQKHFIPNREYDLWDVVADSAGAIIGLLFSLKFFIKK